MFEPCDSAVEDDAHDDSSPAAAKAGPPGAHDVLVLPLHKRLFKSYLVGADGRTTLQLNFGEDEIVFDDPGLFAFGEGLAAHARFVAGDAARWGAGTPWPKVRELLSQLLEAGFVRHAADACPAAPRGAGLVPSPLGPSACATARDWRDCEAVTRDLTGRELPLAYLELVVPVYRVAHPTLDAEGRQVGEANVFPAPLRLDVETEWRVCQHAGSRYQDAQPMNVSSLRSMVRHWKPALALLARLRDAYLRRCPRARPGWTVGEMQRLTSFVLAVPGYLLMKAERPLANGELAPMLSSLFRVVDGVRMVMHRMMFTDDNEASRAPDAPVTPESIYAYAERNTAFLSDHGVCAGPKLMIEELLRVLCDGLPGDADATTFGPQVDAALAEVDRVLDYALLGLQAYAAVFSTWPEMARTYERLATLADDEVSPVHAPLRELARRRVHYLQSATRLRNEARRTALEQAYADMFVECGRGLGASVGPGETLPALLAVPACAATPPQPPAALSGRAGDLLLDYFRHEQRVLRLAAGLQSRINAVLGRAPAPRPLCAADLALHYRLVAFHYAGGELRDHDGRLPCLADDLEQALGVHVHVDAERIVYSETGGG